MAGFKDIIGQEQLIEYFKNSIKQNKIYHAYILNGEDYSGKKMIANGFAMTIQCENSDEEPCMECHSCKQVMSNNHPDIIWVGHEKVNSIGVEDIREQINNDVMIKPYSSRYKIYIVEEADKMTVQAQNALLKTIEEPPEYVIIMLLSNNSAGFLQTILSRCVVLNIKPIKSETIKSYLIEKENVDDYKAEICAAFAQGNLGKAIKLAKSEDFANIKDEAIRLVKNVRDMELHEVMNVVGHISDYKISINDFFDILIVWYRDVLMFKAVNDANGLVFKEDVTSIIGQAAISSYNGIERIIEGIDKAKQRLKANVNFDLVIELLLLTIKEN